MAQPLSVSQITAVISEFIENNPALRDQWIQGEVSNMTRAKSGHWYFTLKDNDAALDCAMWKSHVLRNKTDMHNGDQVKVFGSVGVYATRGKYQFYAQYIEPVGIGDLYAEFERLKAILTESGLFDAARKQPLPAFPRQIGVVTSPDAAAFQDVLNVLRRRFPLAEVVLSPSLVQGREAPAQLALALRRLDAIHPDVILIVRGGGSIEDLWAFNDEGLVRAIADAQTPIVSGVGHEVDFTLTDFAADHRAPTPSAAAEVATPNIDDYHTALQEYRILINRLMTRQLIDERQRVTETKRQLMTLTPARSIRDYRQRLDELRGDLSHHTKRQLDLLNERLAGRAEALAAASPAAILRRGYAILTDADGKIVRSVGAVQPGNELNVQMSDGALSVTVNDEKDI